MGHSEPVLDRSYYGADSHCADAHRRFFLLRDLPVRLSLSLGSASQSSARQTVSDWPSSGGCLSGPTDCSNQSIS